MGNFGSVKEIFMTIQSINMRGTGCDTPSRAVRDLEYPRTRRKASPTGAGSVFPGRAICYKHFDKQVFVLRISNLRDVSGETSNREHP